MTEMKEREGEGRDSRRTWRENLLSFLFFDDEPFELCWGQVSTGKGVVEIISIGTRTKLAKKKAKAKAVSASPHLIPPISSQRPDPHLHKIRLHKLPPQSDKPIVPHTPHLHTQQPTLIVREEVEEVLFDLTEGLDVGGEGGGGRVGREGGDGEEEVSSEG